DDAVPPPPLGMNVPLDSVKEQVEACVEVAPRADYDFLVRDQTRPDVEVPVVRVIVPGLRSFYKRFGPGRLYDVPVKMGLLDRPLREGELTPFLPHTSHEPTACAPRKSELQGSPPRGRPPRERQPRRCSVHASTTR